MKLCSACLLGVKCRYNGESKANQKVIDLAFKETLIPVCPEQMGGLPTPRKPAEQKGNKVVTIDGVDVSSNYKNGANQVLGLAKLYKIKTVILKQGSPSCGSGQVYDGTFTGTIIKGDGVTAKLLKKNGIRVLTENDL